MARDGGVSGNRRRSKSAGRRVRYPWGMVTPRKRLEQLSEGLPARRKAAVDALSGMIAGAVDEMSRRGSPVFDYLCDLFSVLEAKQYAEWPRRMAAFEVFLKLDERCRDRGIRLEDVAEDSTKFEQFAAAWLRTGGGADSSERGASIEGPREGGQETGPEGVSAPVEGSPGGSREGLSGTSRSPSSLRVKVARRALPPGAERVLVSGGKGGRPVAGAVVVRSDGLGGGLASPQGRRSRVLGTLEFEFEGRMRRVLRYGPEPGKTTQVSVEGDVIREGAVTPSGEIDPRTVSARNAFILSRPQEFPPAVRRAFLPQMEHPFRAKSYGGLVLDLPLERTSTSGVRD